MKKVIRANYNHGNKFWQKSQFAVFVTPFFPSLNVVIALVSVKSTRFNTNKTLKSEGGEGGYY